MANTLTALAPVLYSAAQVVSAEPFGVIDSIDARFDDKRVAAGDTVKVPVAPMRSVSSFTPSMAPPTGDDAIADSVVVGPLTFDKVSWNLTGEQELSLANGGNDLEWVRQMLAQGMRALRNKAEIAAATAIKQGASRAVGAAGTTPFATTLDVLAEARKVLQDNGAPLADLQFAMDTAASLNLRKLGIFQQAYAAGSDQERRTGQILPQFGFRISESAGIGIHTKGTGASYLVNNASGELIGDTGITVDTGTGTILAGDVVTFAADAVNKYVVGGALASNNFTLNRPGLKANIADNNAITVGNNYTANLAFERSSVVGIMRAPMIPANPTISQMAISDGRGMNYLLLDIAGYGMRTWELHLAHAFKAVQPEHIAIVMG